MEDLSGVVGGEGRKREENEENELDLSTHRKEDGRERKQDTINIDIKAMQQTQWSSFLLPQPTVVLLMLLSSLLLFSCLRFFRAPYSIVSLLHLPFHCEPPCFHPHPHVSFLSSPPPPPFPSPSFWSMSSREDAAMTGMAHCPRIKPATSAADAAPAAATATAFIAVPDPTQAALPPLALADYTAMDPKTA